MGCNASPPMYIAGSFPDLGRRSHDVGIRPNSEHRPALTRPRCARRNRTQTSGWFHRSPQRRPLSSISSFYCTTCNLCNNRFCKRPNFSALNNSIATPEPPVASAGSIYRRLRRHGVPQWQQLCGFFQDVLGGVLDNWTLKIELVSSLDCRHGARSPDACRST